MGGPAVAAGLARRLPILLHDAARRRQGVVHASARHTPRCWAHLLYLPTYILTYSLTYLRTYLPTDSLACLKHAAHRDLLPPTSLLSHLLAHLVQEPAEDDINYISCTVWDDKPSFDAWKAGDAFKEAHGGGTLGGIASMLVATARNTKGKPKAAMWEGLLPVSGGTAPEATPGGWRQVEADGSTTLEGEAFLAMNRFSVTPGGEAAFEARLATLALAPEPEPVALARAPSSSPASLPRRSRPAGALRGAGEHTRAVRGLQGVPAAAARRQRPRRLHPLHLERVARPRRLRGLARLRAARRQARPAGRRRAGGRQAGGRPAGWGQAAFRAEARADLLRGHSRARVRQGRVKGQARDTGVHFV